MRQPIAIIRGTTKLINIDLTSQVTGQNYVLSDDEFIRFGVKKRPTDSAYVIQKTLTRANYENGTYVLILSPSDTESLDFGCYWYDVGVQNGVEYFNIIECSEFDIRYNITSINMPIQNETPSTGGTELPALTNPAAAYDLAADKQLIDADGNVVTGTLGEATEGVLVNARGEDAEMSGTAGATNFSVVGVYQESAAGDNTKGAIIRPGARLAVRSVPTSLFGDATADQVAKGATFTSAAGLLMEGTHECEGGVTLPALSNPGTAADMASGKELIDQYGNVVTGTLGEIAEGQMLGANQNKRMVFNSDSIRIAADTTGEAIVRPGATLMTDIPASDFGDATAADVTAGKTFTSAEGLKVVGTGSGSGTSDGLVVKSGSTTEQTFDTGLSSISYLVLLKKSNSATGLVEGFFSTDACTYVYCISYSTTIKNFSMGAGVSSYSFDGGTFSLTTTGSSGFSSDVTYYWYAFGTE